jgi:hypothetical protein
MMELLTKCVKYDVIGVLHNAMNGPRSVSDRHFYKCVDIRSDESGSEMNARVRYRLLCMKVQANVNTKMKLGRRMKRIIYA